MRSAFIPSVTSFFSLLEEKYERIDYPCSNLAVNSVEFLNTVDQLRSTESRCLNIKLPDQIDQRNHRGEDTNANNLYGFGLIQVPENQNNGEDRNS